MGARHAPLLQARQGLGGLARRRHLSPGAGRPGPRPLADTPLAAVLDLPGVVEGVPGDPPSGVPAGPALAAALGRWRAQAAEDGLSEGGDSGPVLPRRLAQAEAEPARVSRLGRQDVGDDLVAVAPTTTRPLAKLGRGAGHHPVEDGPRPLEQGGEALRLLSVQRPAIAGGLSVRSAEVGGRGAGKALDHLQVADRAGRGRQSGCLRDQRVAGRGGGQRLERLLLPLARPAPTRPVQGAGKSALGTRLDVDSGGHQSTPTAARTAPR
ncbi:MAG: hypothetical protein DLM67_12875 [Candidatus Nephthysia bennettiae]|nr:MAG: hypothetical protein DLM67_12875 [Candidatus Dormibacteraeota bacterium]